MQLELVLLACGLAPLIADDEQAEVEVEEDCSFWVQRQAVLAAL
jgi:hypothetical protein